MKKDRREYQKKRYNRLKREGLTVLHFWVPKTVLTMTKRRANLRGTTLRQYIMDCLK